jgi:hypothetical protein
MPVMTNPNHTTDETDPTRALAESLTKAYDFFNTQLFGGRLPPAMITLRARGCSHGFFVPDQFGASDGSEKKIGELALNPRHFRNRSIQEKKSANPGARDVPSRAPRAASHEQAQTSESRPSR